MPANGNQPTSFRLPFTLPEDVNPQVQNALRLTFQGVKDLNDAVRKLNTKVRTNTAAVTTINQTIATPASSGGGGGSSPAIGNVNLQPGLTPGAYTLAQSDLGGLILVQSGIAFALTLDNGLVTPFFTTVYNLGVGTITATPTLNQVNNGASVTIATNEFAIIFYDGVNWWAVFPLLPVVPNFADDETPSGAVDGLNQVFTLVHSPNPSASLMLHENGLLQDDPTDYTLAGNTITFVLAPPPGTILTADYRY